jgi:flavin-dependent dehydrogenase
VAEIGMTLHATGSLEEATGRVRDVVVVGAGPAGAMSALLLARAGLDVLLVERRSFPRYKVCGGYLNAHALAALERAGLAGEIEVTGAAPIAAIRIHRARSRATIPLPPGRSVSRAAFDALLVRSAVAAGVFFLPETMATIAGKTGDADGDTRRVILQRARRSAEASGRVVVVADGLGHPSLRGSPGLGEQVARRSRLGLGAVLEPGAAKIAPGAIEMVVGRSGYAGLSETGDGRVNIAAAVDAASLRTPGGAADAVASLLRGADLDPDIPAIRRADWHGTLPLTRTIARPAGRRLFVLGDAAGYVEPFTGEGMAWALTGAEALVPFVAKSVGAWRSTLAEEWIAAHRSVVVREQRWCRALARALRRPWFVTLAVALLRRRSGLARPIIDHLSPRAPSS